MQICLNDIWNRMIANKKKKIRTYFYIDEAHLFLRMPSSAEYIAMVWKRARKWMGTPTFITQNVEDMLRSAEGNTILSTSDFAVMLSQSPLDRAALSELFHISPEQQEFFTHTGCGEGLIIQQKQSCHLKTISRRTQNCTRFCPQSRQMQKHLLKNIFRVSSGCPVLLK